MAVIILAVVLTIVTSDFYEEAEGRRVSLLLLRNRL